MRLRDALRGVLSEEELSKVPSGFDIVGSREGAVAIVEIPPELSHRAREIGEAIMRIHRNVRLVLAKASAREGVYRTRKYVVVAGTGPTEVVHKEHGIRMKVDVTKVYFSPREATERLRVAKQVRPGETVMVFFAGVGPYALVIARTQPRVKRVIAIEINPIAYKYMVENVKMNKLEHIIVPVLGDVRNEAKRWYGQCDRVVMPLPKGAYMFLDEAYLCLRPQGGFIHFYHWAPEDKLFLEAYAHLERAARLHGFLLRLVGARIVSPYAPRVYKVAVDVAASALR